MELLHQETFQAFFDVVNLTYFTTLNQSFPNAFQPQTCPQVKTPTRLIYIKVDMKLLSTIRRNRFWFNRRESKRQREQAIARFPFAR